MAAGEAASKRWGAAGWGSEWALCQLGRCADSAHFRDSCTVRRIFSSRRFEMRC